MASSIADTHMPDSDQAAVDTDVAVPGFLKLPSELCDDVLGALFKDVVLLYQNDGHRASLRPVRGSSDQALAVLRACRQLYHQGKPVLQAHATVIVHAAAQRDLGRDTLLLGSPFWRYTRRFRSLHAHGLGAGPVRLAPHLQSLLYWNEAYQLRDLLHMWPYAEAVTLGGVTIPSDFPVLMLAGRTVPQELVFQQLVAACHTSQFTFLSTVLHAARQHGIGQDVTFLIRFRIQVSVWCQRDLELVERDICHGVLNPETGWIKYHEIVGFSGQQLPSSAMVALVDRGLNPDVATTRPLPSDLSVWSVRHMWEGLRNSCA